MPIQSPTGTSLQAGAEVRRLCSYGLCSCGLCLQAGAEVRRLCSYGLCLQAGAEVRRFAEAEHALRLHVVRRRVLHLPPLRQVLYLPATRVRVHARKGVLYATRA